MSAPANPLDLPFRPGLSLVEASAGTGKTFTLSRLALRAVLEKEADEVSELLVVTFTNAAAAELHTRIRKEFRSALACLRGVAEPADDRLAALIENHRDDGSERRLRKALIEFDEISVSTIHGFCSRTLEIAAFECGIPFRTELVDVRREAMQLAARDFWRREVGSRNDAATALAAFLEWNPDDFLKDYTVASRYPNTEIRPQAQSVDVARKALVAAAATVRKSWASSDIEELLAEAEFTSAGRAFAEALPACLRTAADYCEAGTLADTGAMLLFSPDSLEKHLRKRSKDEREALAKIQADPFVAACRVLSESAESLRHALRAACIDEIDERLQAGADDGVLAYDDLLRRLDRALGDPDRAKAVAEAIRSRYRVALIDEFQDTDLAQYDVFTRLFAGRPLIIVGDPKQAIYGFRGADVFAYLEAKKNASEPVTLTTNWRSTPEMIGAINAVFDRPQRPFVIRDIEFEPVEAAGKNETQGNRGLEGDGRKALCWLSPPKSRSMPHVWDTIARGIAAEISTLLDGPARLDERRVEPSSIAVLTRTNSTGRQIQEALRAVGIPAIVSQANNVFASDEAADLECLVCAIARPNDAGAVTAAMATRFWGADAAEVSSVSADDNRFDEVCAVFERARESWTTGGFAAAIEIVFVERSAERRLLDGAAGERRLTNARQLVELCQTASQENHFSPEDLRRWLGESRNDSGEKREEHEEQLESDADAVRITTIFKAKGLEYDIVFCPDLWYTPAPRGGKEKTTPVHTDNRTVVLAFDEKSKKELEPLAAVERLSEDARLTYVALTRARHRCYVIAFPVIDNGNGNEKFAGDFHRSTLAYEILGKSEPREETGLDDAEYCRDALAAAKKHGPDWSGRLEAFVEANSNTMQIDGLVTSCEPATDDGGKESSALSPRRFSAAFDRLRSPARIASFSALVQSSVKADRERPDHDAVAMTPGTAERGDVEDVFAFEKGARAGTCLHDMFERVPFDAWRDRTGSASAFPNDAVRKIVEAALTKHRIGADEATLSASAKMLHHTLRARLPGATNKLCDVDDDARIAEWQFYIPMTDLRPERLAKVFAAHAGANIADDYAQRLAALDARRIRGHLTGFVDLVFESNGLWYVLDWKSNHLGDTTADYGAKPLWNAMCGHDYVLQYHLYVLGLHRYLGTRLPAYDYETSFGGVYYAFLRGIREDGADPSAGWYFDRPPADLIRALDDVFARGTQP
jgi:exodeoxyribonuclease V beta subunit